MRHFNLLKLVTGCSLVTPFFVITSCGSNDKVISILYTNDVHTAMNWDSGLNYSSVKGFKNFLESEGQATILVDSGDFSSGGIYGSFNNGKFITKLMNTCSYDLCIPGNHEFDYGMARFYEIKDELNMPMISSNFYHMENSKNTTRVLDDTKVFNVGNKKIGFVGVSTPETLTTSNPKNFLNDKGELVYGFCHNSTADFYSCIQKSIDSLVDQKCDDIIALAHLGEDTNSEFNSVDLAKNTTGLNAILDGHSHTFNPATIVKSKDNKDVVISQTGSSLYHIGCLTIDKKNNLSFNMINSTQLHDDKVDEVFTEIKEETEAEFSKVIGTAPFTLTTKSGGQRAVRTEETNLGDVTADAILTACNANAKTEDKADFAVIIGGGIRQDINAGQVTKRDVLNVLPFANDLWKIKLTGQKILDVLEYSAHKLDKTKSEEWGGYLQVSDGLEYKVDLTVDSPVIRDATGWKGFTEGMPRRIKDCKIKGTTIDPSASYIMGGIAYTIRDYGDGYNMLKEGVTAIDMEQIIDSNALASFLTDNMSKSEFSKYQTSQGRVTLIKE